MKKNTFKKLMSAIVSMAMLVSMMVVPANAVVPGENVYNDSEGYIVADFVNNTREFVPQSDVPAFMGTGTYDALAPADREQMESMSAAIEAELQQEISPMGVDAGDFSFVSPTSFRYSGVVVVAKIQNGIVAEYGTGFMVDRNTVLTALHCIFPYNPTDNTQIQTQGTLPDIRVYFNVDTNVVATTTFDELEISNYLLDPNRTYISISTGTWASAVEGTSGDDRPYDWFIGDLASNATGDIYYWNCVSITSSLEGTASHVVGYPKSYALEMVDNAGEISNISAFSKRFHTTNSSENGMSGGPIYYTSAGVKCAGIFTHGSVNGGSSTGVKFYDNLLAWIAEHVG